MTRVPRFLVLSFSLALPLLADLYTGPQVAEGLALPVVVDLNGDGLTDIVVDKTITTTLERNGSTYEGTTDLDTSCGRQFVKITATAR